MPKSEFKWIILLMIIVLIGFGMRWRAYVEHKGKILDPDAEQFFQLALKKQPLFSAIMSDPPYVREPFFIWLINLWFLIMPPTRESFRLLTVLLSCGVIITTFLLAKIVFGQFFKDEKNFKTLITFIPQRKLCIIINFLSLLSALLSALSPQFIFMSIRGLRFELYLIFISIFFALTLTMKGEQKFYKFLTAGVIGGILNLIRSSTLSWLLLVLIVLTIRNKWLWWRALLIVLVSTVILIPHLIHNYKFAPEPDPFFTANIAGRFYRNLEFKDQPGFPTSEEFKRNSCTGEPITMFQYYFKLHTFSQLLQGSLLGFKRIFLTTYSILTLFSSKLLVLFYFSGLLYFVWRGQWHIPAIMLLMVAPLLYLASIGIDWRLVATIAQFQYICVSAALLGICEFLIRIFKKLAPTKYLHSSITGPMF